MSTTSADYALDVIRDAQEISAPAWHTSRGGSWYGTNAHVTIHTLPGPQKTITALVCVASMGQPAATAGERVVIQPVSDDRQAFLGALDDRGVAKITGLTPGDYQVGIGQRARRFATVDLVQAPAAASRPAEVIEAKTWHAPTGDLTVTLRLLVNGTSRLVCVATGERWARALVRLDLEVDGSPRTVLVPFAEPNVGDVYRSEVRVGRARTIDCNASEISIEEVSSVEPSVIRDSAQAAVNNAAVVAWSRLAAPDSHLPAEFRAAASV